MLSSLLVGVQVVIWIAVPVDSRQMEDPLFEIIVIIGSAEYRLSWT